MHSDSSIPTEADPQLILFPGEWGTNRRPEPPADLSELTRVRLENLILPGAAEARYAQGPLPEHLRIYQSRKGKAGFVYLATDLSGLVKIGVTTNPQMRMDTAAAWNPTVRFLALFESRDIYGIERTLHSQYGHKRQTGEWFDLSAGDLERIIHGKAA